MRRQQVAPSGFCQLTGEEAASKVSPNGQMSSALYRIAIIRLFIARVQALSAANLTVTAAGGDPSAVRRRSGVRVVESETPGRAHTARTEAVDGKLLKTIVVK